MEIVDATDMYFNDIFSDKRLHINRGESYSVDHVKFMKMSKSSPMNKNKFGQAAKARGIKRKQCRDAATRIYKYFIPSNSDYS